MVMVGYTESRERKRIRNEYEMLFSQVKKEDEVDFTKHTAHITFIRRDVNLSHWVNFNSCILGRFKIGFYVYIDFYIILNLF